MLRVEEYRTHHLEKLMPIRCAYTREHVSNGLRVAILRGHTVIRTIFYEDSVAAIVGCTLPYPGLGEIFSYLGEPLIRHPLAITRAVRAQLHSIEKEQKLQRTHVFVDLGDRRALRWAKVLGFTAEAILSRLGPNGQDTVVYARVHG